MSKKDILYYPENNQWKSGYVTLTIMDKELITYGFFDTRDEATKWAENLINSIVIPVYQPVFNQG